MGSVFRESRQTAWLPPALRGLDRPLAALAPPSALWVFGISGAVTGIPGWIGRPLRAERAPPSPMTARRWSEEGILV